MRCLTGVLCCLFVTGGSVCAQFLLPLRDEESPLQTALLEVYRKQLAGDSTREKLEEQYLSVLTLASSREEEGLVYAQIASMYSSQGIKQPHVSATYAQEALTYPLPVEVAAQMYSYWSDALAISYDRDWSGQRYAVARRRIVRPLLDGLRLVLDNGAPKERVEVPAVGRYSLDAPPNDPALKEAEERHAEEMAARRRADLLNDLAFHRNAFISGCIALYLREPAAPDELERLASEALADHPEALQDLLEQLAAKANP